MSWRNPARGRRTQRRAAERRALKESRRNYLGAKRLEVPEHIQNLTDDEAKEADRA